MRIFKLFHFHHTKAVALRQSTILMSFLLHKNLLLRSKMHATSVISKTTSNRLRHKMRIFKRFHFQAGIIITLTSDIRSTLGQILLTNSYNLSYKTRCVIVLVPHQVLPQVQFPYCQQCHQYHHPGAETPPLLHLSLPLQGFMISEKLKRTAQEVVAKLFCCIHNSKTLLLYHTVVLFRLG